MPFRTVPAAAAAALVAAPLAAAPLAAESPSRRSAIVEVVERVGPAVVNISTEQRVANPFGGGPWDEMFRDFFDIPGRSRERVQNSLGSGVIVDPGGAILTNFHVIAGASRIRVTLADKRQFDAEAIGADEESDLAVLKVEGAGTLPAVAIHEKDDLLIGETVVAIGNPFGLSNTVSVGVVSGRERALPGGERVFNDFIQTDAAINPGNSGGALLNIDGELIGINSAIIGGATGIGFAIPASRARTIYQELARYREVRPVWLGLETRPTDAPTADSLGLGRQAGLLVTGVTASGPGGRAGVEPGDLLVEAEGRPLASRADLDTVLGRITVGQALDVKLVRDGAPRKVSLKVAAFPSEAYSWERIGLHVLDIGAPERQKRAGLPEKGVLVSEVRGGSPADQRGLEPGDAIVRVGEVAVGGSADYLRAMPRLQGAGSAYLGVVRGGRLYRVSLRLDAGERGGGASREGS